MQNNEEFNLGTAIGKALVFDLLLIAIYFLIIEPRLQLGRRGRFRPGLLVERVAS
jgi:hypothetical protein